LKHHCFAMYKVLVDNAIMRSVGAACQDARISRA
jgi:hypothetical protein